MENSDALSFDLHPPPGLTIKVRRVGSALQMPGACWPRPRGYCGIELESPDLSWNDFKDPLRLNAIVSEVCASPHTLFFIISAPPGFGSDPLTLKALVRLVKLLHSKNHLWSLDAAFSDVPCGDRNFTRLLYWPGVRSLEFHTCMYNLRRDASSSRHMHRRILISNVPQLSGFVKTCDGSHKHSQCRGRARTPHGWLPVSEWERRPTASWSKAWWSAFGASGPSAR